MSDDGPVEAIDVVLVNAPTTEAKRIARALVDEQLAACVNIVPGVTSIYRWEGKVQEDAEVTLLIKTRRSLVGEVTARVRELHTYSVPEVVALPVAEGRGNRDYLAWVAGETREPNASVEPGTSVEPSTAPASGSRGEGAKRGA